MTFEDADEITYEMANIEKEIIKLKGKKIRSWQEQEELELLQAKLWQLRSIER